MKSKLGFLVKYSLKKKMCSKWFIIINLLLFFVIVGLVNVDKVITSLGGDFEDINNIIVVDNTDSFANYLEKNLELIKNIPTLEFDYTYKVNNELDIDSLTVEDLKKDDIVLVVNPTNTNFVEIEFITNDTINTVVYQMILSALNNSKTNYALEKSGIDVEEYTSIATPITIERVLLNQEAKSEEQNSLATMAVPIIILPFFMLTMLLVQMIGAEVNEEKSTKSMEVILSNVSAKTHFLAKVIAGNVFVLSQGLLLMVYVVVGLIVRVLTGANQVTGGMGDMLVEANNLLTQTGLIDSLVYIIPLIILLLVLSFMAYSLVAAILSAMSTNQEDFQQVQTPIIMISLIGYYLSLMAPMFEGSLFIKICSYVPFISVILSPTLLMSGDIGVIDFVISVVLMVSVIFLLFKYGLRAYKVGILNYSSSKLWTKLYKSIRNKD